MMEHNETVITEQPLCKKRDGREEIRRVFCIKAPKTQTLYWLAVF